jgi:MoxR-like ATPase
MNDSKFSFQGKGQHDGSEGWRILHRISLDNNDDPADYHIEDPGLIAAVTTALTLGMPLLLTGAPGVGKTQLAYRIAYELSCGPPIFFPVKSGCEAQDLFYHVDHLRRLHAAQVARTTQATDASVKPDGQSETITGAAHEPVDIRRFIRFQGLGLAILRALPEDQLRELGLWEHAWPDSDRHESGYGQARPSVVLIDEIDKAPIDFPNDILEEIRKLEFSLPELGTRRISLYANTSRPALEELRLRPQVVITSNSERGVSTSLS